MPVHFQTPGYHTVIPYVIVPGVAAIIDFLKNTFDAVEIERMQTPAGDILHAEVKIGDSTIMFGEPKGDYKAMPTMLYVFVADTDATYKRALAAGARSVMEPADQFYGDRNAGVADSSGNLWWIATHIEDVSKEEMQRRAAAMFKGN